MSSEFGTCDLCGRPHPFWAWTTPNQYPSIEEAREHDVPWYQDEVWYVCNTCHDLILQEKWDALLQRALMELEQDLVVSAWLDASPNKEAAKLAGREQIRIVHQAFRSGCTTYKALT